jgi:hypothetical protein
MMPEMVPGTTNSALDASVAQRQSATLTPWRSEGQHLPDALGPSCPLGGWSRMERQVDVAHLAGSSILLIHPGSDDPQHNAAGRDGDLTGFIRPTISGQYGALRLGPGRSPRTVLLTIRVGVSTRGPNHLAPVAQPEEAAVPNPACARSNRVGGTSPVMLGWLSARFVRGIARVRHSPPALGWAASSMHPFNGEREDSPARRASARGEHPCTTPGSKMRESARSGALFSCHCDHRDRKQSCRTKSIPT